MTHPQERRLRNQLAACYRIFHQLDRTKLIHNHITVRLPDAVSEGEVHFLIDPAGFTLHSAIHRGIPGARSLSISGRCNGLATSRWRERRVRCARSFDRRARSADRFRAGGAACRHPKTRCLQDIHAAGPEGIQACGTGRARRSGHRNRKSGRRRYAESGGPVWAGSPSRRAVWGSIPPRTEALQCESGP